MLSTLSPRLRIAVFVAMALLSVLCTSAYCQVQVRKAKALNPTAAKALLKPLSCTTFNPSNLAVKFIPSWQIVDGDTIVLNFGLNSSEPAVARNIMKYYKMNQQYFIGRPLGMQFYLIDGDVPAGPAPGEKAYPFDPSTLSVTSVGTDWQIVENGSFFMDFGLSESNARTALTIIRSYGFNYLCYVGKIPAGLTMVYFRQGATTPGVSVSARIPAPVVRRNMPPPSTPSSDNGDGQTNGDGRTKAEVKSGKKGSDHDNVVAHDFDVVFTATITATAPCEVIYSFVRNDGTFTHWSSMQFDAAGSRTVQDTLSFDGSRTGWDKLRILWPYAATSNTASYQAQL